MRTTVLAALAVCFLSGAAFADTNEHQQLVDQQMSNADNIYRNNGYSRVLQTGSQSLADDGVQNFSMDLVAGQSYSVVGFCDKDCSDLDITVYAPNGSEVAEDSATDDAPVVTFNATQSGRYKLAVKMYECSVSPCFFSAAVYRGTGSGAMTPMQAVGNQDTNQFDQQVLNQLDLLENESTGRGMTRLFRSPLFRLDEGASQDYNVTLTGGKTYMIAGVCDNDCPDMDIKLLDASGNEIAEDTQTDSVPIVSTTPRRSGVYVVRVIMYDCDANPCSAGLTVMGTR